jgi:hypothetical protein
MLWKLWLLKMTTVDALDSEHPATGLVDVSVSRSLRGSSCVLKDLTIDRDSTR